MGAKGYTIAAVIIIVLGTLLFLMNGQTKNDGELNNTGDVSGFSTDNEAFGNGDSASGNTTSTDVGEDVGNTTVAVVQTNKGEFTVELFNELAPKTVENFTTLAESGFYTDVKFHRVIPDFMIQGGDPLSKDDSQVARWGTGGPGYTFEDEIHSQNRNSVGTLSMANAGPNTNGSQFFINVADNNFLDDRHTVFGRVTSGLDVVLAISKMPTDPSDRPLEAVMIQSISIK